MNQNNTVLYLLIALVVIALGALFVAAGDKTTTFTNEDANNTISVSGESERFVAPDTASISFSLTRKSKNLSEATDSVNERVGNLLDVLASDGIKESDVKTTSYNVYPQYVYTDRQRVFDGYQVTQSMQVKIRDLDNVAAVVSKVGELQVDNVSGLSFFIDDDQKIMEELREEAIDDAKDKAKKLSKDLGVDLSVIVGFSEGGNGGYYPQPYLRSASFALEDASFEEASIPAGENRLSSQVTITYSID